MSTKDHRAVFLYAVLARDPEDFIDMVNKEEDPEVLLTLHAMLTTPNPDSQLNSLGASLLKGPMKRLGLIPIDASLLRSDS